jgi:hypothetical protein
MPRAGDSGCGESTMNSVIETLIPKYNPVNLCGPFPMANNEAQAEFGAGRGIAEEMSRRLSTNSYSIFRGGTERISCP